jgi:KAP family P-loop domain
LSLEQVLREVDRFIGSDSPEVMAIVGNWGLGKTYAWKSALLKAKVEERVFNNKYSYVSLFGVNDITKLKFMIFENMVGIEYVGIEPNLMTLRNNLLNLNDSDIPVHKCSAFSKLRKFFGDPKNAFLTIKNHVINFCRDPSTRVCNFFNHLQFYWRKTLRVLFPSLYPINETIQTLSYASINSTLICFDDLERTKIDIKDILGIVSELKEQKNCKIVLIFNENQVHDEKALKAYNEKVIDINLNFDIDAEDATDLVFKDLGQDYSLLRKNALKLNIRNIRILTKISWFYEILSSLLDTYTVEFRQGVLNSLVLFVYATYESDKENVPTLEYIKNYGFVSSIEQKDENEQRWANILSDYGYAFTDELDLLLIETVKKGYVDQDRFNVLAKQKNDSLKAHLAEQSFTNAWKLFHDDLEVSEDVLVETLITSFNTNIKHITPINLDGTVTLLRELGHDKEADKLVFNYIEAREDEPELFDSNTNHMFNKISDALIIEKFKEIYTKNSTRESAKDVLDRLAFSNGWNPQDEVILLNTSIEEFVQIFKAQKTNLSAYIDACLRFGRATNATEDEKKISDKVKLALTEIAKESRLNEVRMKKYGIVLKH